MRILFLAVAAFLPFSASATQILGNTPDTVNQNVIGCYGGTSGNSTIGPCFNGAAVANNNAAWIGVGWTMGANAQPFLEADVMLIDVGFAPCNGCGGLFSGFLFSDNAGIPGSLIATLTPTPSETKSATPTQYAYKPGSPITLQANTSYWLLLRAGYPTFALLAGATPLTGTGATYLNTLQGSSTPGSNTPPGANPIAALTSHGNSLQPYFVLNPDTGGASATPEPGTFLLVAGVLVAAGFRRLM